MKVLLTGLIVLLLAACTSSTTMKQSTNGGITEYGPSRMMVDRIDSNEIKMHLYFLASDAMGGRGTGTDQLKIAAYYLAGHLKQWGYQGKGDKGTFFQRFPLYKSSFDNSTMQISYDGKETGLTYPDDAVIYGFGHENINIDLPVEYIASGFNMGETQVFNPASVDGKIAVRMDFTKDQRQELMKRRLRHQSVREILYSMGARVVVLLVDDNEPDRVKELFDHYKRLDSNTQQASKTKDAQTKAYIIMRKSTFAKWVGSSFDFNTASSIGKNMSVQLKSTMDPNLYTQNVIGYLPGSDPKLKNEIVGWGAHYDHLGTNSRGEIFNGANDDGSGTSGLLAVAKALAKNPPKRSVMIIFHAAEERGLWGSEHFVENPTVDLKKLVAMVNMDMIGSNFQSERIYVVGADRISQELHDINEMTNAALDSIVLDYEWNQRFHPERIYYRSDHFNYAKNGVPIIFFSDKDPDNYHKASDTPDKINYTKLTKVSRLSYATGYTVANQPTRLKITNLVVDPVIAADVAAKFAGKYSGDIRGNAFAIDIVYEADTQYMYAVINGRKMRMEPLKDNPMTYHASGIPFKFTEKDGKIRSIEVNFGRISFTGTRGK